MKNSIQTSNAMPRSAWRRLHWLNTALLAIALATPLFAESVQDQEADKKGEKYHRPHVVRPDSKPFGHTYGEWAAKWWQWALSIPADPYHPLKDQEGDDAARGQSGPVWFLAGVINESGTVVRHATVPTGKALFFPVLNTECSTVEPPPYHGDNEAQLRTCAQSFLLANMACEIDGKTVGNLTDYVFTSPLFEFTLPANNILGIAGGGPGQAVDHGAYVMVKDLHPGEHMIHFRGTFPDFSFTLDITYHLTVEEAKENQFVASPRSKAYGKSLAEWLSTYWRWAQTGSDPAQSVINGVQLMPLPAGSLISGSGTPEDPALYRGQVEITLDSETPFVLPEFAWIGERYNNGNPDDPMIANDVILAGVSPYLTIDGRLVISDANEAAFYVPPTPFDPIVNYPAPTLYGSIAAFAFQGVGIVGRPLPVGVHKIHLYEPYILPGFFGTIFDNTWIITVKKAPRHPLVVPPQSRPHGKAYSAWGAEWWKWAYSFPAGEDKNPVQDPTGALGDLGQSGPVWFLAGSFGKTVTRSVTVPTGKALFFPIINSIWFNLPDYGDAPWSPEQNVFALSFIAPFVDNAFDLGCQVDGVAVANLTNYRTQTRLGSDYEITIPEGNITGFLPAGTYGPCVDDGIWLMLKPLKEGEHTIHFTAASQGSYAGDFALDVTYHLTVAPKKHH